jgi:hypothetical protein
MIFVFSALTVRRILFMFDIQELIHLRLVQDECEQCSSKKRGSFRLAPKFKTAIFLKTAYTILIKFGLQGKGGSRASGPNG